MIMQRDVFTVSSAALILWQLLSGEIHAAAESKNNVEMVRIPGGVFLMGSSDGPEPASVKNAPADADVQQVDEGSPKPILPAQ